MNGRLEQLQAMAESGARPPVAELLGMELVSVQDGRATMAMDVEEKHTNTMGLLHGGVYGDLADGAMGAAFASTLEGDETFATVEYDVKLLRPVRHGRLEARAVVVKRGGTTGLVESDIVAVEGEREELVARASSTCLILRGEAGEDRQVGENLVEG